MTAPRAAAPTAKTIRAMHGAMISGVVLFGFVAHFVMRRNATDFGDMPPSIVPLLPAVAIVACIAGLVLYMRVPRRSSDESADLFWRRAASPALITWAALEAAGLIGVFLYGTTGSISAIGIAAVAVVISIILKPGYLERR